MRESFDSFLAWYFGLSIDNESASIRRSWRLEASWNWQTLPTLLLLLSVVIFTFWLTRASSQKRSFKLFGLLMSVRLASLFCIALLIFQVQFKTVAFGKPYLIFLVDTSGSMSLSDRYTSEEEKQLRRFGVSNTADARIDLLKIMLTRDQAAWIRQLENRFDFQLLTFDSKLHELPQRSGRNEVAPGDVKASDSNSFYEQLQQTRATGVTTDFKTSLEALSRREKERPPAAVIIFSDGFATVHPPNATDHICNTFQRMHLPVFSVGIGSPGTSKEIRIEEAESEPVGFTGDDHPVSVHLSANEFIEGPIHIRLKNIGTGEELVAETLNQLLPDKVVEFMLVIPRLLSGQNDFEIEVQRIAGEYDIKNNSKKFRVWGRDAKLNLLLIEQYPGWEFRHLKTTLERDPYLTVKTFLFEGDPGYAVEDRTALARLPETLEAYDAVIIGDIDFNLLPASYPALIERHLKQNGGLLLMSGEQSFKHLDLTSVLADVHPAIVKSSDSLSASNSENSKPFPVEVSVAPEGRALRILPIYADSNVLRHLPNLYTIERELSVKPSALTLLEGGRINPLTTSIPLVFSMRYGPGLVLQNLVSDTWRWRAFDGGGFYRKFWAQMIRNLCRRKLMEQLPAIEFFANQDQYHVQEDADLFLIDRNQKVERNQTLTATWRKDTKTSGEVTLTRSRSNATIFTGTLSDLKKGEYLVSIPNIADQTTSLTTTFDVVDSNVEKEYHPLDETILRALAEGTKGHFFYPWELDRFSQYLPNRQFTRDSEMRIIPLWNRWELFMVLLFLVSLEWVIRRRTGLE